MGRLLSVAIWFIGLAITTKILLPGRPLGYFWLLLFFLSLFFGLSYSGRKETVPDDFNYQQRLWWEKYQSYSYLERQQFLTATVNNAQKMNQLGQIEGFLKAVVNSEPENELAQSLLISIWGSEIINTGGWKNGRIKEWNSQNINQ
jgi:hypothetical protein